MFILFDEEKTILEFAKRGIKTSFNKNLIVIPKPEPLVGWQCKTCNKIMKISLATEGICISCNSPELNPINGEENFKSLKRLRFQSAEILTSLQTRF